MAINFPNDPQQDDIFNDGDNSWQWDGTSWNLVTYDATFTIPNGFGQVAVAGQTTVAANSQNAVLTLSEGDNITITTDSESDTITIAAAGGGGGDAVTQNLFETFTFDDTDITASSATDSISINAGTNVTLDVDTDNNVVVINSTAAGGGDVAFTDLTDLPTGLTIDKIYKPAMYMLTVTNAGNTAYRFDSHYSSGNPTIYAINGTTIAFNLDVAGHPFEIQNSLGDTYSDGLTHVATDGTVSTGVSAQGKTSGTLYWDISFDISGTYRYQCQSHVAMVGGINIKSFVAV